MVRSRRMRARAAFTFYSALHFITLGVGQHQVARRRLFIVHRFEKPYIKFGGGVSKNKG